MIKQRVQSIFCLITIGSLGGCSRPHTAEEHMAHFIQKTCADRWPCTVNLRSATPFAWDKLYSFYDTAKPAEIQSATGYAVSKDARAHYFIFMKDGKIVYTESYDTTLRENARENEVMLDRPDGTYNGSYSASSNFTATKTSGPDGPYYHLELRPQ